MKKSTRKFISLILALCLLMAFAISVSADATYTSEGTYKNQGYVRYAICNERLYRCHIGSTSPYMLKVRAIVHYLDNRHVSKTTGYLINENTALAQTNWNITYAPGYTSGYKVSYGECDYYIDYTYLNTNILHAD